MNWVRLEKCFDELLVITKITVSVTREGLGDDALFLGMRSMTELLIFALHVSDLISFVKLNKLQHFCSKMSKTNSFIFMSGLKMMCFHLKRKSILCYLGAYNIKEILSAEEIQLPFFGWYSFNLLQMKSLLANSIRPVPCLHPFFLDILYPFKWNWLAGKLSFSFVSFITK